MNDAASGAGRELPLAEAALSWLERAESAGRGEDDYSAVVETITEGRRTSD